MKKTTLILITIFTFSLGYSQDSNAQDSNAQDSKVYLGISLGVAIPGGDISEDYLETGIDLGLINFGYRFTENWGATLNLVSSGHTVDGYDDATVGVAYLGLGPMYTTSISDKISWDIKPQIALGLTGVEKEDGFDDYTYKGNGFVLGNSLVFGTEKGFKFSINLDYLTGKFTEYDDGTLSFDIEDDNGFNKFSLGVGVRYNF